jgi:hypothetical protein
LPSSVETYLDSSISDLLPTRILEMLSEACFSTSFIQFSMAEKLSLSVMS